MARKTDGNGKSDRQVELLRSILGEMKALRASFESQLEATRRELGGRIDQTNERLDSLRAEMKSEVDGLRRRVVESEVRLATATTALSNDVHELSSLIRDWREEHRADRAALSARVSRLEEQAGVHERPPPYGKGK
ncbi:MAG: hypothetical protein ACOX6T_03785 [Myxococcales bacterium]|jgi:chromosome segregation ATPase